MQRFLPGMIRHMLDDRTILPEGLVVNVNVPGVMPSDLASVEVSTLGRRIYRDKLELKQEEGGRRHYLLYGDDPEHHEGETDTDIAVVGRGSIAVTPLRFKAHDETSVNVVESWNLPSVLD
jgi:5'-nucleotidase